MRYLIGLIILLSAPFAFSFENPRNTTTDKGCEFNNPFNPVGRNNITYSWTGECRGGKLNGWGFIDSSAVDQRYFTQFSNGEMVGTVYFELNSTAPRFKALTKKGSGTSEDLFNCTQAASQCAPLKAALRQFSWTAEVTTSKGCHLSDGLSIVLEKKNATWSGECRNGSADGYGWYSYNQQFQNGIASIHQFLNMKNGKQAGKYSFRIDNTAGANGKGNLIETSEFAQSNYSNCRTSECQYLQKMGQQGPDEGGTGLAGGPAINKSGNSSANSAGNSNANASGSGDVSPAPRAGLGRYEGQQLSCDDATIGAAAEKVRLSLDLTNKNLCVNFKESLKFHYWMLTTFQKSCPNETAIIQDFKDAVQKDQDGITNSCQ